MSSVRAIIGLQWGDEGKGKIVDYLSGSTGVIARFQGGANAGHTVQAGNREIVLHQIPSGIVHEDTRCLIGNGVVVDPQLLIEELDNLEESGIDPEGRLGISPGCHLVFPYHRLLDGAMESFRDGEEIGTTGRGIGPSHADKVSYWGIRMGDLFHPDRFRKRLRINYRFKKPILNDLLDRELPELEEITDAYLTCAEKLSSFVQPVDRHLLDALEEDRSILLEGAQGTLLDVDLGTYPYVTASNASAAGLYAGTALPHGSVDRVMVVGKTYTTRVGKGPFPTEEEEAGKRLREEGNEFGSTTGRPRRCGWFDLVASSYACRVNGADELALTKLDILSGFDTINVCVGYRINGERTDEFPMDTERLKRAEPVYRSFEGWSEDITGCRTYEDLPGNARTFVEYLEDQLGVPVSLIGVGPARKQIISRSSIT